MTSLNMLTGQFGRCISYYGQEIGSYKSFLAGIQACGIWRRAILCLISRFGIIVQSPLQTWHPVTERIVWNKV